MFATTSLRRRWVVVALAALTAGLAFSASASAERSLFFEETASAFWAVPYECADGSTVQGTLLVLSTRDFESAENLKSVSVSGSGIARDNLGVTHLVSFDVTWTAVGPLQTTVNGPGSKRQQREATATGQVTFDGEVLVDGDANHPTRPAPFIRVDTEK
jgi:hypothetical protein